MMKGTSRIADPAGGKLRHAIREAGGVEVFAIGDVEDGTIVGVVITCRGAEDRVTALLDRPRAGQVVIHNHPSGVLTPSDADMHLASLYGENGVGFVIVDSSVTRTNFVVEPHVERERPVDPDAVRAFFEVDLPRVLPDVEPRAGQLDMALRVAAAFSDNRPLVVEAGTGTGKSLAYLVPAALWALANDAKVVISTHTKALQSQLLGTDLVLLGRAGSKATYAVLQGRANYLCKRRLGLAVAEDAERPADERAELDTIAGWDKTTSLGSRGDLPIDVDAALWERVESDSDLTLRVRCPHYAVCHYYQARRKAAAAHLVVVNHALLLADLSVRDGGGSGILPKFRRLVLDEAHHLEDAATGAIHQRVSARGIARAVAPLLSNKRRRGALERLITAIDRPNAPLFPEVRDRLVEAVQDAVAQAPHAVDAAKTALAGLASEAIGPDGAPFRVTLHNEESETFKHGVAPTVIELAATLDRLHGTLDAVLAPLEDIALPDADAQPLLDVRRAARRIAGHAEGARNFLEHNEERCRWVEAERGRNSDAEASIEVAPIDVAQALRRLLWSKFPGTIATSATMAVAGRFDFWLRRVGLAWEELHVETAVVPSPFDHATQALLAMPRDLPEPETDAFLGASTDVIVEAIRISDGGAFVLCTSYAAVEHYANALRKRLDANRPVLAQGKGSRSSLLDRFREDRRAVLVATDAFWEGVSVKGEGLRLVIIPRLPFRVPTEPLRLARYERIALKGGDPFRAFSLPEATIKLRQGYGRLIRHKTDRGVVLLLDRRVHDRSYGQIMLRSLPPARRISAPWARIAEELRVFYGIPGAGV
jgi:ATP-dependent DNA helicase DinG